MEGGLSGHLETWKPAPLGDMGGTEANSSRHSSGHFYRCESFTVAITKPVAAVAAAQYGVYFPLVSTRTKSETPCVPGPQN